MHAIETQLPVADAGPGDAARYSPTTLRVLVVARERATREGCAALLGQEGHRAAAVAGVAEGRGLMATRRFDLVLIDGSREPEAALDMMRHVRQRCPDTLTVLMADAATSAQGVAAMEAGAWEYLPKPFSATQLGVLVGRASHALGRYAPPESAERAVVDVGRGGSRSLLGVSPGFRRALTLARQVAATDASVVITGESGTGKEMIARYIHALSRRGARTFVPINCAALPEALLESEIFGHCRGAFTGADRDKPGILETADEGTMFLDEVTEMSHAIQAKFLRVLQDGVVRRVGSERVGRQVDVRIVAATNREPQGAVRDGILRRDLYFRLWVFPIHLPPLRERPEDVIHLASYFLEHYWARHRGRGTALPSLLPATRDALLRRPWPGNVRELQNTMERLAVTAAPGQGIAPEDLPDSPLVSDTAEHGVSHPALADLPFRAARDRLLGDFERSYLGALLRRADRNLSRAARLADMDRATLYRLLDKHGLDRTSAHESPS